MYIKDTLKKYKELSYALMLTLLSEEYTMGLLNKKTILEKEFGFKFTQPSFVPMPIQHIVPLLLLGSVFVRLNEFDNLEKIIAEKKESEKFFK